MSKQLRKRVLGSRRAGPLAIAAVLCGAAFLVSSDLANAVQQRVEVPPRAHKTMIRGIPAPYEMVRVTENDTFAVPAGKVFCVTGIITTVNWGDVSPVVVRFNGIDVFKRGMLAGEVVDMPPGLVAQAGSIVEIDRLSAAQDSRVTLLGFLDDNR